MQNRLTSIFLSLFVLNILGISVIWSTAPSTATKQVTALALGIILGVLVSKFRSQTLRGTGWLWYFSAVSLLLLTEILGLTTRGSTRWIDFGFFNLQSSEVAKPLLIVFFASFLGEERDYEFSDFVKVSLLAAVPIGLIFIEPDLGSAIAVSIIWFGMILSSKIEKKYILGMVLIGLLMVPVGLKFLKPYQTERLTSFVNPFKDPSGSGYNVIQAMIAVGSGQLMGMGVRQGTQSHLKFLPERHTDFAFASFSEEFGFLGVTIMLVCFGVLLDGLLAISKDLSTFGRLCVMGFFWWILGQMVINTGMNMGIMPVTGITLPFISYGSSSVASLLMGLGLVVAVSKER